MQLNKVIFKDYRCFEELEIELDPRLTVITGANGSGKTSILDGMATILSKSFNYLSTANQRFKNQGRKIRDVDIRKLSHENVQVSQSADFSYLMAEATAFSDNEDKVDLKWDAFAKSTPDVKKPNGLHGEKELKAYVETVINSYQDITRKETPVFAYYSASAMQGTKVNMDYHADAVRSSINTNYSYPTAALINALTINPDNDKLQEVLDWFHKEETKELRQMRENGEIVASSLEYVRQAISKILGENYSNPRFNDKHQFMLTKQIDNHFVDLSLAELIWEDRNMITVAMDFSRRLVIANHHLRSPLDAPAIILIDDIDLLFGTLPHQKIEELMQLFRNTQFIITTTNKTFVDKEKLNRIRILDNRGKIISGNNDDVEHAQNNLLT